MAIYGATPYGPLTPAVRASVQSVVQRSPFNGQPLGSRRIDPVKRDVVIDPTTGRELGMTNAQQLVYMAVQTEFGSSAQRSLGNLLRTIKRMGPSFERQVDTYLRRCVAPIVAADIIEVIDTIVLKVRPGVGYARLRWRDVELRNDDLTDTPHFAIQE